MYHNEHLRRYASIDQLASTLLVELDKPLQYHFDTSKVAALIKEAELINELKSLVNQLRAYQAILQVNHTLSCNIAMIAQTHIIDLWRVALLTISNTCLRYISEQHQSRSKFLGNYIQQMQERAHKKTQLILSLRNTIRILGDKLRQAISSQTIEPEYEMVIPKAYAIFGSWFKAS